MKLWKTNPGGEVIPVGVSFVTGTITLSGTAFTGNSVTVPTNAAEISVAKADEDDANFWIGESADATGYPDSRIENQGIIGMTNIFFKGANGQELYYKFTLLDA